MTESLISISSNSGRGAALVVAVVLTAAGVGVAHGHGASKGLHLHLVPEVALPGSKVTVRVDAVSEVDQVVVGFAGSAAITRRLKPTARHIEVELVVPAGFKRGTTASVQAEATGGTLAKPLRASSLLIVGDPSQPIVLP